MLSTQLCGHVLLFHSCEIVILFFLISDFELNFIKNNLIFSPVENVPIL